LTDACNFRCTYCLPDGYQKPCGLNEPLSVREIHHLVSAFAALGFCKIRLTGGEPSLRRDLVEIVETVSSIEGIEAVALSTNGARLKYDVAALRAAGLTALNVSLDSLDPQVFERMTGSGASKHADILAGIDKAFAMGFDSVKLNAVLMKGVNDSALDEYIAWVKDRDVSVRFIELMRTGRNRELFEAHHISGDVVHESLKARGWQRAERKSADGPAVVYRHSEYRGQIGVIAPYSHDFCSTCNRLRVSSLGNLRLCLFGEGEESLRDLLQDPDDKERLVARVQRVLGCKPDSHYLQEGKYGKTWNLSAIGG
jgi:cyclic pyranopterin phosphate synthase